MRFLLLLLLCLSSNLVIAQHDNIWYFGRRAGFDFSSGSPMPLTNSAMSALEGSAVMSDENGSLLFYSNGVTVWNRNHAVMPDGSHFSEVDMNGDGGRAR